MGYYGGSGRGSAKAWVRFFGTTINAGFNVASITKNFVGGYTIIFTNVFSTSEYVPSFSIESNDAHSWHVQIAGLTNSQCAIYIRDETGAAVDPVGPVNAVFFGDQ